MPRKRKETLDFVEGLIRAADKIEGALEAASHPRDTLHGNFDLDKKTPDEIQEMGKYQGRVVLMSLAAELALKFAWEAEHPGKTTGTNHDLQRWFQKLSCTLRKKVSGEYCKRAFPPMDGWRTASQAFKNCKDSSVGWRYIVEEGQGTQDKMQATYLKHATLSVVAAAREMSDGTGS